MKKGSILLFTLVMITLQLQAQEKRVFGGPSFHFTNLDKTSAWGAGGFGGYHLSDRFYLGGAGQGVNTADSDQDETSIGYGGLLLGYIWGKPGKINLKTQVLTGLGGVDHKVAGVSVDDGVGVIILTTMMEFEISRVLKLGVGMGYRHIYDQDITSLSYTDLSGLTADISFRFGKFR